MEKAKNKWDGSTNSTVGESLPLCIGFVGEKQGWVEFLNRGVSYDVASRKGG